jgi:hypothetical protein
VRQEGGHFRTAEMAAGRRPSPTQNLELSRKVKAQSQQEVAVSVKETQNGSEAKQEA